MILRKLPALLYPIADQIFECFNFQFSIFGFRVSNFEFWILNFEFWILWSQRNKLARIRCTVLKRNYWSCGRWSGKIAILGWDLCVVILCFVILWFCDFVILCFGYLTQKNQKSRNKKSKIKNTKTRKHVGCLVFFPWLNERQSVFRRFWRSFWRVSRRTKRRG